jgi:hypothetical protein
VALENLEGRKYGIGRPCKILSVAEAAYVAGLIDGEGCIGMVTRKPTAACKNGRFVLHVSVAMTSPLILDWLIEITGIGTRNRSGYKPSSDTRSPFFRWQVTSSGAASLVEQLLPYLRLKQKNASALLRVHRELVRYPAQKFDKQWLLRTRETFRALNQKGPEGWLIKKAAAIA